MGSVHGLLMSVKCGKPAKMLISSSSIRWWGQKSCPHKRNARPQTPTNFCWFQPFLTKKSEKSNRKKILPTSWRSQTPSKTPSMHPPDQAKHNKSSLDANGRLEVIFYDVLCIVRKKNRPRRLSYNQLSLKLSQWITLG